MAATDTALAGWAQIAANAIQELLWVVDNEGRCRYLNGAFAEFFGCRDTDLLGTVLAMNPLSAGLVTTEIPALRYQIITERRGRQLRRVPLLDARGRQHYMDLDLHPVILPGNSECCMLGVARYATDEVARELATEADFSRLTYEETVSGLPNRRRLLQWLQDLPAGGLGHVVMKMDIDHFGRINDSYGREAGDGALRAVAARLRSLATADEHLAHIGGDRFALLMPAQGDEQALTARAQQIIESFREPLQVAHHQYYCTLSAGLAASNGARAERWLTRAEVALHRAKRDGRNRAVVYRDALHESVRDAAHLYLCLRQAIELEQLQVHYEPQLRLSDGQVFGFEALTRWTHPELAQVSVLDTIHAAEEHGLIGDITALVVNRVRADLMHWRATLGERLPRISINISPVHFASPGFLAQMQALLLAPGVPPHCLQLEITESAMMPRTTREMLQALREQGIHASLDDFGTGYSSLSLLHTLPVDELKIDRSFLPTPETPEKISILSSIIAMARNLHLRVMAEGIETEAQQQLVTDLGCDYVQGFYYSRTLTADQALAFFAAERPLR